MLGEITQAMSRAMKWRDTCVADTGKPSCRPRAHPRVSRRLRTTQRYPIYRALKHPLYPILRKIDRIHEHIEIAQARRPAPDA